MTKVYKVNDLVFAKVKGYPAWPAKITGVNKGAYSVFFFGTHEVKGDMRPKMMWPYNQKTLDRFGPPNKHKKWYGDGLHQIENMPNVIMPPVGKKIHVPIVSKQEGLSVILDTEGLNVDIASTTESSEEQKKTSSTPRRYYDEVTKSTIMEYVIKMKNLGAAARKFKIPYSTVCLWARKARIKSKNEKLRSKTFVRTVDKKHDEEAEINHEGLATSSSTDNTNSGIPPTEKESDIAFALVNNTLQQFVEPVDMLAQPELLSDESKDTFSSEPTLLCSPTGVKDSCLAVENNKIIDHKDAEKCKACGYVLETDESFAEHIVSVHLTIESSCNVCGEYSEDMIEHFKKHTEEYESEPEPMVSIKTELLSSIKTEVDDTRGCIKKFIVEDVPIKHEEENKSNSEIEGMYLNPFYCPL